MRILLRLRAAYLRGRFRRVLFFAFAICAFALILPGLSSCGFLEGKPDGVVELARWEYRLGFDPARPELSFRARDKWKPVTLPRNLTAMDGMREYTGWMVFRRALPNDLAAHLKAGQPLALNAGRVLDVSYYYIGRVRFGSLGSHEPYKAAAMRHFIKDMPFVRDAGDGYVYIALYSNGKYPLQFMDRIEIGPSDAVYRRHSNREVAAFALLMIYLASGAYHLLLFVRRPVDRFNLYFGLFAVIVSFYWFVANTTTRDVIFSDFVELHRKTEHAVLFLTTPLFVNFMTQFFNRRHSIVGLTYMGLSGLAAALVFPGTLAMMRIVRDVWYLLTVIAGGYIIFYIIREIIRGNKEAWYLIGGVAILMGAMVHDIIASMGIIESVRVTAYVFLIFVSGLAGLMAARFMRITGEVEELNADLEKKVEDRTRELRESLRTVQTLKEQQDADYFLTSLLIKPLARNQARAETISVDMLSRQKKTFRFRHWDSEIGGDISIADTIHLRGRDYTVFINGDGMGKSIQGAGGALVLGTVFHSVLNRTRLAGKDDLYPEHWLKECLLELQHVFETFEGSMMISIVMGLLENNTGMLYYMNAEHPAVALYRNGFAGFVEPDSMMRKVGVPGIEEQMEIQTFRMQPGDVMFMGSDGRDDLDIGVDEEGARIINEDENLFLLRIAEGKGRLEDIEKAVRAAGELTDDFSLLRLGYREGEPLPAQGDRPAMRERLNRAREALRADRSHEARETLRGAMEEFPGEAVFAEEGMRLCMRDEDVDGALAIWEIALVHHHADAALIYLGACALKLAGRREEAADLGERLRLREPGHVRNLINLADNYRLMGNGVRARELLDRALEFDADNRAAMRLRELMNGRF